MAKAKSNTVNSAANGSTKATYSPIDLATIRGNFDGLQKQVNSLPDGKQKKNLMNAIEDVYFWTAQTFKGIAGSASFEG